MEHTRTVLYLCRHGEVASPHLSTSYGHLDVPLSERGVQQSKTLRSALSRLPLEAVYSSDLERAAYAAELVAAERGLTPVFLPELREIGMGKWEGRQIADINQDFRELVAEFFADPLLFKFPEGESFSEFIDRVDQALTKILNSHNGDVALIAHAGVCRAIIGRVLDVPAANWLRISQDFGCVSVIEWLDGLPSVKLMNYSPSIDGTPLEPGR
jgi:alpha-ribazole phosphatase